jgi:FixJ family two-component response regulator
MPELGGDELAAMIKVLAPGLPILMLTGFADLMGSVDELPTGVDLVIGKPTTLARLRVAIATLTGDPQPAFDLNAQWCSPAALAIGGTIVTAAPSH